MGTDRDCNRKRERVLLFDLTIAIYSGDLRIAENECWVSFCGQPVVYTPEPTMWRPQPHWLPAPTKIEGTDA